MKLSSYIIRRTIQSVVVLLISTFIWFYLNHKMPGNPFAPWPPSPAALEYQKLQTHLHLLDQPIWYQYVHWLWVVLHGNFGYTTLGDQPIFPIVVHSLFVTLQLVSIALVIALLVAIPLGVQNSTRPYSVSDNVSSVVAYVGFALPSFWLALMAQTWISVEWNLLPASSMYDPGHDHDIGNILLHMILPVTILTLSYLATYLKYARNTMLEILPNDYIRTARAKGVPERRILFVHAFRNAMIPMITVLSMEIPALIATAVFVEAVFRYPGLGSLILSSASGRDYTLLMGTVILVTVAVVVCSLLADIAYGFVDPRIRQRRAG